MKGNRFELVALLSPSIYTADLLDILYILGIALMVCACWDEFNRGSCCIWSRFIVNFRRVGSQLKAPGRHRNQVIPSSARLRIDLLQICTRSRCLLDVYEFKINHWFYGAHWFEYAVGVSYEQMLSSCDRRWQRLRQRNRLVLKTHRVFAALLVRVENFDPRHSFPRFACQMLQMRLRQAHHHRIFSTRCLIMWTQCDIIDTHASWWFSYQVSQIHFCRTLHL